MFENLLKYNRDNSILIIRNFDRVLAGNGGLHMEKLNFLLSKLDKTDYKIIQQIYAILYRYLEKRGRL